MDNLFQKDMVDLMLKAYLPLFKNILQGKLVEYVQRACEMDVSYHEGSIVALLISERQEDKVYIHEAISMAKDPKEFFRMWRRATKGAREIAVQTQNAKIIAALKRLGFVHQGKWYILRRKINVRSN
jgi:hypothetical protein